MAATADQDPGPRYSPAPCEQRELLLLTLFDFDPFSSQPQTIIVDVAQSLDEIQAPRDAVKSTAIALVRVDSNFLPGTTIGATHWVAYAMTKGVLVCYYRKGNRSTLLVSTKVVFA